MTAAWQCSTVRARTATGLGIDADRYRHLMAPLCATPTMMPFVLGPFDPSHATRWRGTLRLRRPALRENLAGSFHDELAPALMTGRRARHGPLGQPLTSVRRRHLRPRVWLACRGGRRSCRCDGGPPALIGGETCPADRSARSRSCPRARSILDTTPRAWPSPAPAADRYRRHRGLPLWSRHLQAGLGPGRPDPWRTESVGRAGTVRGWHLARGRGGRGRRDAPRHPERPFVILVQASKADPSRAPEGRETG
jgi:hypothetical protein